MKKNLNIYAPWIIYYRKVEALFKKDPEIHVNYNDASNTITIYVDNREKAEAFRRLLPAQKNFGNVILTIDIIPSNFKANSFDDIRTIFNGNEAFSHTTVVSEIPDFYISNPIAYCSFVKEVVQYPADDLGSETGMESTLYENLAREIFDVDGVYFCTDSE